MSTIGARIRYRRQQLGMTLAALADASGISKGYLHLLESQHETNPTIDKLMAIAAALEVTTGELIGDIQIEDFNETISDSLSQFADDNRLPSPDVVMLSQLKFRGRAPETQREWRIIYNAIKAVCDKSPVLREV